MPGTPRPTRLAPQLGLAALLALGACAREEPPRPATAAAAGNFGPLEPAPLSRAQVSPYGRSAVPGLTGPRRGGAAAGPTTDRIAPSTFSTTSASQFTR